MPNKKVKVINLFAGPGCGKSTGAAFIFSILKMLGVNAELVTEFAKDKTWEENFKALACQPYVAGKQIWKMDRCIDGVDVIITDSPIVLSTLYNHDPNIEPYFSNMVISKFNEYDNYSYLLNRVKPYNPKGRNQTKKESMLIDDATKIVLERYSVPYTTVDGSIEGYTRIVEDMVKLLKLESKWEELKECLKSL
jgi:hypothetical protein